LSVDIDSFLGVIEESPLVRAAAPGLDNAVELLATNLIAVIRVSDFVSSWAAACGEDRATALLDLFTAGVVVDQDDFLDFSKLV